MLASMGVQHFHLVDPGLIEDVNVGPQQWDAEDVGDLKVEVLGSEIDSLLSCRKQPLKGYLFARDTKAYGLAIADAPSEVWQSDIFICAIDDMDRRAECFERWRAQPDFHETYGLFVDGRMSLWTGRVLSVDQESLAMGQHYEGTLFPQSEADPTPCTARATVFGANIIASCMVRQCLQWLRQEPLEPDYTIGILSLEVDVARTD